MRKKCFKKTISLALCIVMSVTMTGTPVLADAFTDGSQSIISENAEIPTVDVESATNCGDVASTEENLTEPALLSKRKKSLTIRNMQNFPAGMMQKLSASFPMTAFRLHRQEEIMLFTWIRGQEMIQMMEAV